MLPGNKGPAVLRVATLVFFSSVILRQWGLGISGPAVFAITGIVVTALSVWFQFVKGEESSVYMTPTWVYGTVFLLFALVASLRLEIKGTPYSIF